MKRISKKRKKTFLLHTKTRKYKLIGGSDLCSPKNNNSSYTCLSRSSLQNIAKEINRTNSNKININSNKKHLWNSIRNNFQTKCSNEWCWIQQETVKRLNDENINKSFRPEMPSSWINNNREWLSTTDIEEVMEQYQEKYNDFLFLGPVPIDFDANHRLGGCVVDELCKLNIKSLYKKNITKLGIVFNLDKHNEPGSHWVALFSNFKDKTVYYYDSYATGPQKEIQLLMDRIENQLNSLHSPKKTIKDYNHIRHQYKGSECGVYSMMFIINMLENNNFKKNTTKIVLDDEMNQNRYKLYNPPINSL